MKRVDRRFETLRWRENWWDKYAFELEVNDVQDAELFKKFGEGPVYMSTIKEYVNRKGVKRRIRKRPLTYHELCLLARKEHDWRYNVFNKN